MDKLGESVFYRKYNDSFGENMFTLNLALCELLYKQIPFFKILLSGPKIMIVDKFVNGLKINPNNFIERINNEQL